MIYQCQKIQCRFDKQAHKAKNGRCISPLLLENIQATLKANKQVILFQIGGYAPREMCMVCS